MALPLNATLTVSCEASEENSGPTIVHSTGVGSYRVQPEVIRILQESCSNDKLCDHEKGVQCTDSAAHIVQTFQRAGFEVTAETTSGSRKLWILTKTSEGGANPPSGGDAGNDDQGGDNEGRDEEEEEGEE